MRNKCTHIYIPVSLAYYLDALSIVQIKYEKLSQNSISIDMLHITISQFNQMLQSFPLWSNQFIELKQSLINHYDLHYADIISCITDVESYDVTIDINYYYNLLIEINRKLFDLESNIRKITNQHSEEFYEFARQIHNINRERSAVKYQIDANVGMMPGEVKFYF